jgi:hypothetical protein
MERTKKTEAVWAELSKAGINWDADIADMIDRDVRTCDAKDTVRQIAKRIRFALYAA